MANKLDLKVTLDAELGKVDKSIASLRQAGAFSGEKGARDLTKIQSLVAMLKKADLSNLKGTELTTFLNNLSKLRHFLDSASQGLTNFSDAYKKALDKVEKATQKLSIAQDRLSVATQKQLDATNKSSTSITKKLQEGFKYKNTSTGGYPTTPESIARAYAQGTLQVFSPKDPTTPLRDAALKAHLESAGIPGLASSIAEVDAFKQAVKKAKDELKESTEQLDKTPPGGNIHPVTEQVVTESAETRSVISGIKESISADTEADIKAVNLETERLTANLNRQSSSLGKAFKQFTVYTIALRAVKKALREAIGTVKELDRALTEQAMVTGLTRKQAYGLLKDYQNMASRLGATTKEVSSTMTEFLRQGRSIAEATKLTEAAVAAAKVAGISAGDSINYLTTAINGFRLSAEDAMKVSDKFAAVAATAAVSYEEIAVALSKVAAQANLAGMSIDYTTALLTKGIETTREAPETIGTALKTIIARMRELTDYGATLEGDTDVNNVEAQLAYIGIQLRDNNGELRSTEDVLNDLGAQWDDLNANQQAAIAKALAGTRQQSRLIAMMQDYERVTELQQIAERSQGATMAQMATYMEGMDAALNKINVAWEEIVSSIVNSDFIIGIVDIFGNILQYIQTIFSETKAIIPIITLIILKSTQYLGLKLREQEIAKETKKVNDKVALNELKTKRDQAKIDLQIFQARMGQNKLEIKANGDKIKQTLREQMLKKNASEAEIKAAEARIDAETQASIQALENEEQLQKQRIEIYDEQIAYREKEQNQIETLTQSYLGYASVFTTLGRNIKSAIESTKNMIKSFNAARIAAKQSEHPIMAQSAAYIPFIGWAIALIIEGVAIASIIGKAVQALAKWINAKSKDDSAKQINDASAAIYNLSKKSTELDTAIKKFDELDKTIIKTNDDLKEMSSILASAADSLSEDEKKIYDSLETDRARRDYLKNVLNETNSSLSTKRQEQRNKILGLSNSNLNALFTSQSGEWVQARDSLYKLNNVTLYDYIDHMEDAAEGTQQLVQAVLEEVSAEKAWQILKTPGLIQNYIDAVQGTIKVTKDQTEEEVQLIKVLNDSDYSWSDRIAAYEELKHSIDALGDTDIAKAFETAYSSWSNLSSLKDTTISWMDTIHAQVEDINNFTKAMRDLGYKAGTELELLNRFADELNSGTGLKVALESTFGDNAQDMLKAYEKVFGTTILNMGQNMDKFSNKIDSVYSKAAEWSGMSQTDRTQFLSENAAMFEGETGETLLNAFNSGDYVQIAAELAGNKALKEERELLLENLRIQIEIEESREDINFAHLQYLKEQERYLEDTENLYLASIETRLKQQDDQLNAYKEYLQKESDALTDSLEKRKEAYQKYFDDINQTAEDQEYDDKAMTLIANISKLSSSTNADAIAKTADLTKQLEELEKERLEELRTRAQELVIQNIEDKVTEISDNLERLLNNEQALLVAMTNDAKNPAELIAAMMSAEAVKGDNTQLGMESYLQQLESTFKVLTPGFNWDDINVTREGDSLILNIAGQNPIDLTNSEQQTIYDAIFKALKDIGKF